MILCVYCGTGLGADPAYLEAARATGRYCADHGIEILYGGAKVGLMGAVADAALSAGGRVTGIMPQALVDREIAHTGLSAIHVVASMHERKALMAQMSDAFVALPGGPGTLDEIIEQWTWGLLGIHGKPVGFLNVNGYYDPLRQMIGRIVAQDFVDERFERMLVWADEPATLIERFRAYAPPPPKWSAPTPQP